MIEFSAGRVKVHENAISVELDPASVREIKRALLTYGDRVEIKVQVSVNPVVQPLRNNWLSIGDTINDN